MLTPATTAPAVNPVAGSGGPFADFVQRAFGMGSAVASALGVAEAAAAFAGGERDTSRLTDVLFNARHRERAGKPIGAGETQAVHEWIWLRDHVIVPALNHVAWPAAGGAPLPADVEATFGRHVPDMRRWYALTILLDRYRGEIPLWFLLGWSAVESGGWIGDVTPRLNERGFFQLMPSESVELRPPVDHNRLSTDPDYSVQSGIRLVRKYMSLTSARFKFIPANSELFWRVVKLQHAAGSGSTELLLNTMRRRGINVTWEAIKAFEVSAGATLNPTLAYKPGRFGHNVDELVARGRAIATVLGR